MIFSCPTCKLEMNVSAFPVWCCDSKHETDSSSVREGVLARKPRQRARDASLVNCKHRGEMLRSENCGLCSEQLGRPISAKVFQCKPYGECTEGIQLPGITKCSTKCPGYELKPPTGPVVVECDRHGDGDALIVAWISEGSRDTERTVIPYATGKKAELLRLFGQEPVGDSPFGTLASCDPHELEMKARGRLSRLAVRAKVCGAGGEPKRPIVLPPSPEVLEWLAMVRTNNLVLFYPQSADSSREWPLRHWRRLRHMLSDDGYAVRMIMPKSVDGVKSWSLTWPQSIALMQTAKLVIGNDSGPVHVAGTLDVPTLAVCGPTGQRGVFDHMQSVKTVSASQEIMPCVGCCYGVEFEEVCKRECKALAMTTPEQVHEVAMSML